MTQSLTDYLKIRPGLTKAMASRTEFKIADALAQAEEEHLQKEKELKDFCERLRFQISQEIIDELGLKFGLGDENDPDPIAYSGDTPVWPPSNGDWVICIANNIFNTSENSWYVALGAVHSYFTAEASINYPDNIPCSPLMGAILDILEGNATTILRREKQ